jgi:hypothetical protein
LEYNTNDAPAVASVVDVELADVHHAGSAALRLEHQPVARVKQLRHHRGVQLLVAVADVLRNKITHNQGINSTFCTKYIALGILAPTLGFKKTSAPMALALLMALPARASRDSSVISGQLAGSSLLSTRLYTSESCRHRYRRMVTATYRERHNDGDTYTQVGAEVLHAAGGAGSVEVIVQPTQQDQLGRQLQEVS